MAVGSRVEAGPGENRVQSTALGMVREARPNSCTPRSQPCSAMQLVQLLGGLLMLGVCVLSMQHAWVPVSVVRRW